MARIWVSAEWDSEYVTTPTVLITDQGDGNSAHWVPTCKVDGCGWAGDHHASTDLNDVCDWAGQHLGDHPPPPTPTFDDTCPF